MSETKEQPEPSKKTLQLLYIINRLSFKAYEAENREALKFIILNDTINLVRYDRAILWDLEGNKPVLIGVSGQANVDKKSELAAKWGKLLALVKEKEKPQILTGADFISEGRIWQDLQGRSNTTVLWLPIGENQVSLGLWLELWHYKPEPPPSQEESLVLLHRFLVPTYGACWKKLAPKIHHRALAKLPKKYWYYSLLGLSLLLFLIRIPMRVVAPCEVVPLDPFVVAAPLEGIIDEVVVDPGQVVKGGETLFQYEKEVPLRQLEVARKQVQIAESELNRALGLAQTETESRVAIEVLRLKLEKEQLNLNLAEYQAGKLSVPSPIAGVVILENRDEWRGKPVQVGEKVLMVTDPKQTKIRIWIPEADNVPIDLEKQVKIVLNVTPGESDRAKIRFIANESTISNQNIPSFIAEADWVEQPKDVRLGLKGTAILYGDRVSLFYYLFRKPWYTLRSYLGF